MFGYVACGLGPCSTGSSRQLCCLLKKALHCRLALRSPVAGKAMGQFHSCRLLLHVPTGDVFVVTHPGVFSTKHSTAAHSSTP
jgi:hypothetical protein